MIPVLTADVSVPPFFEDRVVLKSEQSLDKLVERIVNLLLNPDSGRMPVDYARVRKEREERLELLKSFALSLKAASQAKGRLLPQ